MIGGREAEQLLLAAVVFLPNLSSVPSVGPRCSISGSGLFPGNQHQWRLLSASQRDALLWAHQSGPGSSIIPSSHPGVGLRITP